MPSPPISNWADLPIELLGLILIHLSFTDHIRLGSVCVSWRSAVKRRIYPPRPPSPWLLLPADGPTPESAKFHSPADRIAYTIRLPLPAIRDRICIGSSHGWLVTLSGHGMLDVHLLNPLTRVQIPLPSLTTLFSFCPGSTAAGHLSALKAILSSPPSGDSIDDDFTVILLHQPHSTLSVARARDASWTLVARTNHLTSGGDGILKGLSDLIHYKGKLHTVDCCSVHIWDEDYRPVLVSRLSLLFEKNFLVESLTGELLMVVRTKDVFRSTRFFAVMRLDTESKKWHAVHDLGDNILFVGGNCSMSISATMFPEFRRNCIYYTEDVCVQSNLMMMKKQSRDAGVFDVKEKKLMPLGSLDSDLDWPPAIWVTPGFAV